MTAKEHREQLGVLAKQIKDLAEKANGENRDFSAEEQVAWEKMNADYDAAKRNAARAERVEGIATELQAPAGTQEVGREDVDARAQKTREEETAARTGPTEEQRALAMQAWATTGSGIDLTEAHRAAVKACKEDKNYYRDGNEFVVRLGTNYRQVRALARESRSLSAFSGTAGAYTIPEGFVNNLEVALLQFNGVRQAASVFRTTSGNALPWPTLNDTTNKGAIISENTTVGTQDVVFAQVVFYAYKYTSKIVLVPSELLQDSAIDMAAELGMLLGQRLGRIQADHFTTGTGASQPTGLVTAATSFSAASATALAADDLYGLKHSVDPAYRPGRWMMHDSILLAIKKLKDGMGRYLFQSSLSGSAPDTLDGDPIFVNQSMDSAISSGKKTVLYGDFSKYKIRDVGEVRMVRLNERYADADQTAFLAFYRGDGNLLDAGTHPVKYLAH